MVASATERIRFYGRRKGRPLSQNMQRLLDEVLPDNLCQRIWMKAGFQSGARQGKDSALTLEIGFGGASIWPAWQLVSARICLLGQSLY